MVESIEEQFKAYFGRNIHHPWATAVIRDGKYYIRCDLCKDDTEMLSKATTKAGCVTFRGNWTRHLDSSLHKSNKHILARGGSLMIATVEGGRGIGHQLSQEARSVPRTLSIFMLIIPSFRNCFYLCWNCFCHFQFARFH